MEPEGMEDHLALAAVAGVGAAATGRRRLPPG